ncbi:MAG TPA: hypothetical protein H9829_07915 [Candidatus Tetragenococcus pullicola]|nr:hypothetical protein [Candidatus Tetragenococcus pullicola]
MKKNKKYHIFAKTALVASPFILLSKRLSKRRNNRYPKIELPLDRRLPKEFLPEIDTKNQQEV